MTESDNKDNPAMDPFAMVRNIKNRGPAPVHLWDPPFCGDMDMIIRRDGSWLHEGRPIRRKAMVQLFASILKLEEDGDYYLVTPVEKVRIQVEDCPFIITLLDVEGQGEVQQIFLTSNTDDLIRIDAAHSLRVDVNGASGEPHPVVHVRNGLNALLSRNVFYQLVELSQTRQLEAGGDCITGVWSAGLFFELGRSETP